MSFTRLSFNFKSNFPRKNKKRFANVPDSIKIVPGLSLSTSVTKKWLSAGTLFWTLRIHKTGKIRVREGAVAPNPKPMSVELKCPRTFKLWRK